MSQCITEIALDWITIKVPKWGQISYEMNYNTDHQIWYDIITYGQRVYIYAKSKSTTLSAYRDIYV